MHLRGLLKSLSICKVQAASNDQSPLCVMGRGAGGLERPESAVCDGGGGGRWRPLAFLPTSLVAEEPEICRLIALRVPSGNFQGLVLVWFLFCFTYTHTHSNSFGYLRKGLTMFIWLAWNSTHN